VSRETITEHALNSNGFPQLRILFNEEQTNDEGLKYASIGVLDSLGNTEWVEVTLESLFDALMKTGLIDELEGVLVFRTEGS
jgi:hypothetical protein